MEISFHVPTCNTQFVGDENCPPAQVSFLTFLTIRVCLKYSLLIDAKSISQVLRQAITARADVNAGVEEAVVTFEGIAVLTPR